MNARNPGMAVVGIGAAAMFVLTTGAVSAKGQGKPSATVYSVTSTVLDTDSAGAQVLLQSDGAAAGFATYTDGNGVVSRIDSAGQVDFNLDLRASTRGLYLALVTTAGGAVPGFPVGPALYSGRVISRCFAPGDETTTYSWFAISGADPNCAMRVNFTSGSTKYTLVMSPGYAGTGRAEVYCNASNATSCVDWTVVTNPNAVNAGVANLYSIARNGSEKFVAACKLTFRMRATYP